MSIVKVKCTDQVLKFESTPVISSGGLAENFVEFSFCDQWAGFVKTAVFWRSENEPYHNLLDEDGMCELPPEVACEECEIYFGVFGVDADGRRRTSNVLTYRIVKGAIVTGTKPSDPAPDVYTQLLQSYAEMQAALANAVKSVTDARDAAAASQRAAETAKKDAKDSADTALAASRGATDSKVAAAQSAKEAAKSAEDAAMLASSSVDWNSGAGETGHVLNRTHYDEVIVAGGTIFPASDVKFNTSMATLNGLNTDDVVAGGEYIVSWKGTTYECTAFLLFEADPDSLVIGNGYLLGGSVDTGEPFCLSDMGSSGCMITKTNAAPETVPVQVDAVRKVVTHKLDPRFLPDGIGGGAQSDWNAAEGEPGHVLNRTHWVERGYLLEETDAVESTDPNFGKCWVIQKAPTLTVGETYTVIYNGVAYDCVCYSGDDSGLSFAKGAFLLGNFSVVGGANTGEPFAMLINPSYQMIMNLDLTGATSVKFGIMGEVVHKMDDKFLPDDVARVFTVKAVTGSSTADGWEVSIDKTFEEIRTHAKDGNTIVRILKVGDEGDSDILPLQFCYDDVATFSMTAITEFKHRTTQTIWVKPDDTALLYIGEETV